MAIDKYASEVGKRLQKAGKATLVFTVEAHPDDKWFSENPPSVNLFILPKDIYPTVPDDLPSECFKGTISLRTDKEDRQFEETVESINKIASRFWYNIRNKGKAQKKKREPKQFWIVAEPPEAWKERYERTVEGKELRAAAQKIPLAVSLRPKDVSDKRNKSNANDQRDFNP
jgi:hypothetical protein